MKTELSLLDLLTLQMNCTYLSDLRSLDGCQRAIIAHRLERLPARAEDLRDWNDALEYLTGGAPRGDGSGSKRAADCIINIAPELEQKRKTVKRRR